MMLKVGEALRRWPLFPLWRFEPCDAAAFLIDEHGSRWIAHSLTQGLDESPYLFRLFDIAPKQDEAPWLDFAKEIALLSR